MGREFWIKACPFLKYLKPYEFSNDDILWLLPYCTGLEKLDLIYLRRSRWREISTTLSNQLIRNLNQMNTLQELSVCSDVDRDFLLNILHRNRGTLQAFTYIVVKRHAWERYQTIWEVVGEMDHIEEICISQMYPDDTNNALGSVQLKQILSLVGRKLKRLTMRRLDNCIHLLADAHMSKLQKLKLTMENDLTEDNWTTISSLKLLTHLTIEFPSNCSTNIYKCIFQLVKSLPKLVELTISGYNNSFSLQFGMVLRHYLKQENRSLSLTFK